MAPAFLSNFRMHGLLEDCRPLEVQKRKAKPQAAPELKLSTDEVSGTALKPEEQ